MKKFVLAGMTALSVVAVGTSTATAQVTQGMCSAAPGIAVCGAAQFSLSNANTLHMAVYNGTTAASAAYGSTLTEIWLYNAPFNAADVTLSSITWFDWNGVAQTSTNRTGDWSFNTGGGQGWMVNYLGKELNGPGGNGGITTCAGGATTFAGGNKKYQTCSTGAMFGTQGDYLFFTFILAGDGIVDEDLFQIHWGFHAQQLIGPPGSIKCVSDPAYSNTDEHDCIPDDPGGPQETVPEPATMTLLATGLVGMAAARRKRNKQNS